MDKPNAEASKPTGGPIEHLNLLNEDDFELIAKLCPDQVYDTLLTDIDANQAVLSD